jgi:ParB family chromosome partitioning protein
VVQRRDYDEITRFVRQLVENIQREDLNDVDRAWGMVRLRSLMQEELNAKLAQGKGTGKPHSKTVSWTDVSKRLGFSRQRASQLIKLLDLPDEIKEAVRQGLLSERNTRVLHGLKKSQQRALYRELEAGDVDLDEYKEVAHYLKEAPEKTVHQAIRILRQPPPSPPAETEPEFDSSFAQEESAESPSDTSAGEQRPLRSAPAWREDTVVPPRTNRVTSVDRLDRIRGHLARIERRGLSTAERGEILRLLKLIQQDVASLITALESD